MRIIRHQATDGSIHLAALQPDGTARGIQGDLFGSFRVTDEVVTPGRLLAPLQPTTIFCIGLNYRKHAEESNAPIPKYPVLFMKSPSAVQNPGESIVLPRHLRSDEVDYECELAVVIGKACKNVSKANALDYVLGYTCANDVSARDRLETRSWLNARLQRDAWQSTSILPLSRHFRCMLAPARPQRNRRASPRRHIGECCSP